MATDHDDDDDDDDNEDDDDDDDDTMRTLYNMQKLPHDTLRTLPTMRNFPPRDTPTPCGSSTSCENSSPGTLLHHAVARVKRVTQPEMWVPVGGVPCE